MSSTKTRPKTVRIMNETAEFYEKVPLNRVAESVHRLLENGSLRFDGEEIRISSDDTVQRTEWKKDLDGMLSCCGIGFDEFMDAVYGLVCEGTIDISDGVRLMEPSWVTRFREVCHEKCIPVEKTMENVCQKIEKGQM